MSETVSGDENGSSRIVPATESEIHDEPHIRGSRVTVRHLHERVEGRGLRPKTVAERLNLDLVAVYEALAYYHRNRRELREVAQRRERLAAEAEDATTLTPPDG